MHHLGVGRAYAGTPALILTDPTTVTVINTTTGQVPSEHDIDPNRTYRRNKYKSPGQWPRLFVTHQATHMSRIITRVELRGFEPLASSMPWKRATNCAIAPSGMFTLTG